MRLIENVSLTITYQNIYQAAPTGVQWHPTETPLLSMSLNLTAAGIVRMPLIFIGQKKTICGSCSRLLYCAFPQTAVCGSWSWVRRFWKGINAFSRWVAVLGAGGLLGPKTSILFLCSFWVLAHKRNCFFYICSHHVVLTHWRPKALLSQSWKGAVKSWGQETLYSLYARLTPSSNSF